MNHLTKSFTSVLLGAAALVALSTGCQREKADVNPTYDPEAQTVNTQFVLSISTGTGNPETKQTSVDVQANGSNFRGITDVHMLTYSLDYHGVGNAYYLYKPGSESSKAVRDYDLGTLVSSQDITSTDSRRILELALPLGTNTIMLYGRAPTTGTADTQGSVSYGGVALNSDMSNVTFKLDARLKDLDAFTQYGDLMSQLLTFIMNAGRRQETTDNGHKTARDNTYKFWWSDTQIPHVKTVEEWPWTEETHEGYEKVSGSKTWKQLGDTYASAPTTLKPLEEVLGEAYNEVMHLKGEGNKMELRAGASVSIVRLVSDMYRIVQRVLSATPTTKEEYIASLIGSDIYRRASYFFHYDELSSKLNFVSLASILDAVDLLIPNRTNAYYNKINDAFFFYEKTGASDTRDNAIGFPMNLNMPSGAAIMDFELVTKKSNNEDLPSDDQYIKVVYPTIIPVYGMGGGEGFPIANYRFPAELTYYVNSSIRTSDQSVERSDYPAVPGNWTNSDYWDSNTWVGDEVTSTTRSVAVTKTVNYGTALLKAVFGYKDSEVEDNNGGVHSSESNNKIPVNQPNKFLVSGIIIGGVNDEVGWNFLPKGNGGFNKMIYDNLNGQSFAIPPYTDNVDARYSAPVYTCTWDNYDGTLAENAQSKVYIGLELVNNTGEDIWGELNLIRNGGTFYLVGELDPTLASAQTNLKKGGQVDLSRADCYYPPLDEDGKTVNAPRVFMQDYVTSVKFLFDKDALQHAYVTMPDLRSGQVSLGLSVDLTWQPGMDFTVNMGETTPAS